MADIQPHTFHSTGLPLSSMLAGSTTWERTLVPIEPAVRATVGIAAGLLGIVVVLEYTLLGNLAGMGGPAFFILGWSWFQSLLTATELLLYPCMGLLGLLAMTAVLTQGWSIAGRRLQRVVGGLVVASIVCLLPAIGLVIITLLNLAAWLAMVALIATAVFCMAALAD
ncbi:hypothetical protein [Mycobacterium sp. ZZG]